MSEKSTEFTAAETNWERSDNKTVVVKPRSERSNDQVIGGKQSVSCLVWKISKVEF